jgi:hypothetical protein
MRRGKLIVGSSQHGDGCCSSAAASDSDARVDRQASPQHRWRGLRYTWLKFIPTLDSSPQTRLTRTARSPPVCGPTPTLVSNVITTVMQGLAAACTVRSGSRPLLANVWPPPATGCWSLRSARGSSCCERRAKHPESCAKGRKRAARARATRSKARLLTGGVARRGHAGRVY